MRAGLYHSLSLYRNRPIWAVAVGGDFALSQEGLTKTVQFFGNNLVQCMKKNSEWSKLFEPFFSYQCQFGHGVHRLFYHYIFSYTQSMCYNLYILLL